MIDPIKPNLPVENTRLKNLFLVLIFTFIASGGVLIVLYVTQNYYRNQLYLETEGALPVHRVNRTNQSDVQSPSTTLGTIGDIASWQTYRNEEYGFEFKYPSEWEVKEKPSEFPNYDNIYIGSPQSLTTDERFLRLSIAKSVFEEYKNIEKDLGPKIKIGNIEAYEYLTTLTSGEPGVIYTFFVNDVRYQLVKTQWWKVEHEEMIRVIKQILSTFKFIQ